MAGFDSTLIMAKSYLAKAKDFVDKNAKERYLREAYRAAYYLPDSMSYEKRILMKEIEDYADMYNISLGM